jgi:hypothetical protein
LINTVGDVPVFGAGKSAGRKKVYLVVGANMIVGMRCMYLQGWVRA